MKPILVIAFLIHSALQSSAQILPPAGEEIKGASLKTAIQKMEAAGIKELKTPASTVKLSDLTALSASAARFMNSTGIGRIALGDLPEAVREQLGYDPDAATGHDQAKATMVQKAGADAEAAVKQRSLETVRNQQQAEAEDELRALLAKQGVAKATGEKLVAAFGRDVTIKWLRKSTQRIVVEGMPEAFAVLAWGQPSKINRSSHGADQWVYLKRGAASDYLYIENGVLSAWQTSE